MLKIEDIKYVALAGIIKSAIEQVAGLAFSFIIIFAIAFIIFPTVGFPLAVLLHAFAGVFGIDEEMTRDAITMMIGGLYRALPMFVILVLIGIGLQLWHRFIESRHSWIGIAFIVIGSLGCLFLLTYVAHGITRTFGTAWGVSLGLVGAPLGTLVTLAMGVPFLANVWSWLDQNIVEGVWVHGTTDIGRSVIGTVLVALSTYVFYSLLASGLLVLAGIASSPLYRGAQKFELKITTNAKPSNRFRFLPKPAALSSMLFLILNALVSSVLAGIIVFVIYRSTYLLVSDSKELSVGLVRTANELGLDGSGHAWAGAHFILASSILCVAIAGWLAYARVSRTRFARASLIEWLVVLLVTMVVYLIAANIGVARDGVAIYMLLGIPPFLIFLFARRQIWQAVLQSSELIRSSQQRSVEEVVRSEDINPILYLRAFIDDSLTVGRGFRLVDLVMGTFLPTRRFEELVAGRGFLWRPIVALGNPHVPFSLHGVLKKDVPNDDWKAAVEYWHQRCAYVLMIANKTENIAWEIDLIQRTKGGDSAIFVVTSVARAREFFNHYAIIPGQPKVPDGSLVVYRDYEKGWVAITSPFRSEVAYSSALDMALARTEHGIASAQWGE